MSLEYYLDKTYYPDSIYSPFIVIVRKSSLLRLPTTYVFVRISIAAALFTSDLKQAHLFSLK